MVRSGFVADLKKSERNEIEGHGQAEYPAAGSVEVSSRKSEFKVGRNNECGGNNRDMENDPN